jgi:Cft2 family RNA processing exonuclease
MNIKFIGAARTVTGSKHQIELWDGKKILVDCGLYQGLGKETYKRNAADEVDAKALSAVLLTHAHMDQQNNAQYHKNNQHLPCAINRTCLNQIYNGLNSQR